MKFKIHKIDHAMNILKDEMVKDIYQSILNKKNMSLEKSNNKV